MKRCVVRAAWAMCLMAGCGPGAYVDTAYRPQAAAEFQVGHLAEAKALFQQALSRSPSDPFALYYLGRIACQEREWEDAIYYLQCCLDADPSYAEARTHLALAEQAAGTAGPKLRFIPLPPVRR